MAREIESEHTGPVLPPSAIALRQGRASLAEAARAGDLKGFPAAASSLMDAYFRDRLAELAQEAAPPDAPPYALVAVGGYGRGELCPASDVDVLVLYEGAVPQSAEELSRGLFHPLWDIGLDLGHGVRALPDGLALAREDTQVLTSLLDIRLIAGSEAVLARFRQEFSQKVLAQAAEPFGQWVLAHNAQRRAEYGDSSGLLEPELKNGLGGLRDVHQIHWLLGLRPTVARPFTPGDRELLEADYAFVLAARTALHLAAKRKTDRLSFDYQPQVARALGFAGADPAPDHAPDHAGDPSEEGEAAYSEATGSEATGAYATGLAVEAFLSRLHQSMTRIRAMRQACWLEAFPPAQHTPALPPSAPDGIIDSPTGVAFAPGPDPTPELILALYVAAAQASRPVAWSALRATRLALADEHKRAAFASLPGALDALSAIFRVCGRDAESSPLSLISGKPKPASGLVRALKGFFAPAKVPGEAPEPPPLPTTPTLSTALQSMLDTGLLAALVPEFGPVEHLVQFDDFHIHPVGKHTLEVVRALAAMPDPELNGGDAWLADRARALPHFERLLLAGFTHDLAKPDRDHSGTGARLASDILRRLGADKDTIADVAFLVREHLLIPKTATRRDLADESVAARLAEVCGTPERLDMLHLLAVADSSSTGPRAWNPWTASLFTELTLKARHLLTSGPLAEPRAVEKSRKTREAALELAAKPFAGAPALGRDYAEACLERMPARATMVLDAPTLARHMELARRFRASLDEDLVRKPSNKAGIGVVEIEAVPLAGAKAFQVSMAALNQPGLFAVMAGVLALHDLNILSAEVLTWTGLPPGDSNGGSMALDMFVVQEPAEGLYLDDLWQRIRRAVSYALLGKLELEYRLEQKRTSPLTQPSRAPKARRKVRVDFE
ncbi:MAG: nucleotidyltransferase domain-containing protein, partial [Proteobacteria bacterium]|nr:nucleotidyltransferase domain-containing protein [Pseudomonadota bacterium]